MSKFTGDGLHKLYTECLRLVPLGGAEFYRKCAAFEKMANKLNKNICEEAIEKVNGFNKEYFPQLFVSVSKILGEEEADKQLSIAYESSEGMRWVDDIDLSSAFCWSKTTQGMEYWLNISNTSDGASHE